MDRFSKIQEKTCKVLETLQVNFRCHSRCIARAVKGQTFPAPLLTALIGMEGCYQTSFSAGELQDIVRGGSIRGTCGGKALVDDFGHFFRCHSGGLGFGHDLVHFPDDFAPAVFTARRLDAILNEDAHASACEE